MTDPLALANVRDHPDPYRAAVARLQAYFPTPALPPSTVVQWIEQLRRFHITDVVEGVETLGHVGTGGKPLQFSYVEMFVEDACRTRMANERPALPSMEEFLELAPEEVRDILAAYWDRVGTAERRALAEARNAREAADGDARVEAIRRLASARIQSEPADAELRRAPRSGPRMTTACGAEVGSLAVEIDGVWCCPNCSSPVVDGCIGRPG